MEMELRNMAQRHAISFVLNSVSLPPQHMENYSRPFGDDAVSRAQAFRCPPPPQKKKAFSESRTFIEDEQRSG
jgi:hypothetical protein